MLGRKASMPARFIVLAVAGFGLFVTAALLGSSAGQSALAGFQTPTVTSTATPTATATATATPIATATATPLGTATPTATATALAPAAQLPDTGTQPAADADFPWLLVGVVALGAFAAATGGMLLRRRAR
jgi:hypothetical protein